MSHTDSLSAVVTQVVTQAAGDWVGTDIDNLVANRKAMKKKDTNAEKRCARSPEKNSRSFTRKIASLHGGLVREMIRCGRANCKCASGSLHGPYYYRVWMERGRRYKTYVKKAELSAVQAGISERRHQMAEVRQVNREAQENWRTLKAQIRRLDQLLRLAGYDV